MGQLQSSWLLNSLSMSWCSLLGTPKRRMKSSNKLSATVLAAFFLAGQACVKHVQCSITTEMYSPVWSFPKRGNQRTLKRVGVLEVLEWSSGLLLRSLLFQVGSHTLHTDIHSRTTCLWARLAFSLKLSVPFFEAVLWRQLELLRTSWYLSAAVLYNTPSLLMWSLGHCLRTTHTYPGPCCSGSFCWAAGCKRCISFTPCCWYLSSMLQVVLKTRIVYQVVIKIRLTGGISTLFWNSTDAELRPNGILTHW